MIYKETKEAVLYISITLEERESVVIEEKKLIGDAEEAVISIDVQDSAACVYHISQSRKKVQRNAIVRQHASMVWHETVVVKETGESEITVDLVAPGAEGKIYSAIYSVGENHYTAYQSIFHKAPHTTSTMFCRGIAEDASKIIYRSMIDMDRETDGAVGKQKADMLVASPKAMIDAIPDLAIRHHVVECSHGVSITKLQDMPLFYLASRGYSEQEAKNTLLLGHVVPIIERMTDEEKRNKHIASIEQAIAEHYE